MQAEQIQAKLHGIDRRAWWLWSTAVMVTLLLTLAVASFAFPALLNQAEPLYSFHLSQGVRGLVGLVLLFNVYAVYQQLQITRIRRQLTEQISTVSRVEELTEQAYKLAVLDPLTGLHNRRSGEQRIAEEILRAQRHGRPLTVLLLDIDGLKQVNDNHGHAAGDALIQGFAERLKKATRGSDVAVRLGGDEFLVVLPECNPEQVRHIIGRLKELVLDFDGKRVFVSFSAGWTNYLSGESSDELLKRADDALYVNKRVGKQRDSDRSVAAGTEALPSPPRPGIS